MTSQKPDVQLLHNSPQAFAAAAPDAGEIAAQLRLQVESIVNSGECILLALRAMDPGSTRLKRAMEAFRVAGFEVEAAADDANSCSRARAHASDCVLRLWDCADDEAFPSAVRVRRVAAQLRRKGWFRAVFIAGNFGARFTMRSKLLIVDELLKKQQYRPKRT